MALCSCTQILILGSPMTSTVTLTFVGIHLKRKTKVWIHWVAISFYRHFSLCQAADSNHRYLRKIDIYDSNSRLLVDRWVFYGLHYPHRPKIGNFLQNDSDNWLPWRLPPKREPNWAFKSCSIIMTPRLKNCKTFYTCKL